MGPVMRHGHRWQAACFLLVQLPLAGRLERSGKQLSGDHGAFLLITPLVKTFETSA